VHAILKDNICIDEHRVFATGTSSGSWLSNELACVSGSALIGEPGEKVIRGIATTTGGLPTGAEVPTCTTTPFAGIWIHDLNDIASNPYAGSQRAVERAIQVNKCVVGGQPTKFEVNNETYWENYPVTGAARQICKKAKGCPAEYPLVMCSSTGQGHGDQPDLAPLAYVQFLQSLNP
jgi:poly(3-hydroxybutyrate) depolymerase